MRRHSPTLYWPGRAAAPQRPTAAAPGAPDAAAPAPRRGTQRAAAWLRPPPSGGPRTPPVGLGLRPSKVWAGRPPPPSIGPAALAHLPVAGPPGRCKGYTRAAPGAARPCTGTGAGGPAGGAVGAPGHALPRSAAPCRVVGPLSPPAQVTAAAGPHRGPAPAAPWRHFQPPRGGCLRFALRPLSRPAHARKPAA